MTNSQDWVQALRRDGERRFERPYVVSWNLTYRCNLACEHCYLDAGARPLVEDAAFADRSELSTEECFGVIDQLARFAPECVTILTGGEPLLRRDILEIVRHAHSRGLWVVIGTNGVKVSENLARTLAAQGVRGMALSLDALDPEAHDRFRMVRGAWDNTVRGAEVLRALDLPFIIQTTVHSSNAQQLEEIADFAQGRLGARVWNLYFLVQTGRGRFASDLSREDYDDALRRLASIQRRHASRMLVNAKCAPHFVRTLFEEDSQSPFLKTFVDGAGGCPAGTHYMGIRPNGDVTPCPYLPVFGGNLKSGSLEEIWRHSDIFTSIRQRESLGGRCGRCEFSGYCGGCRARAYGAGEGVMAEDPLCGYQPGPFRSAIEEMRPGLVYGEKAPSSVDWDAAARERMGRVPAFVRGMVVRRVEEYCVKHGIRTVTTAQLDEIRSRMPASRVFGAGKID